VQIVWITLICRAREAELAKRRALDVPMLTALLFLITRAAPEIHHTSKREMSQPTPSSSCTKLIIRETEASREIIVRKTNLLDQIRAILALELSIRNKIRAIVAKIILKL